jgi:hypothetical protein
MRKYGFVILFLLLFLDCGPKQQQIERYMEDGVEVVLNHVEPYRTKGELTNLAVEEDFAIDTEQDEMVQLGLTDIWGFSVDSNDDIYLYLSPLAQGNLVHKFDREGHFLHSFAPKGQGPGEITNPSYQRVDFKDELPILDSGRRKLAIFDKEGSIVRKIPLDMNISRARTAIVPLKNGNYLVRWVLLADQKYTYIIISLFNSEFVELKELHRLQLESPEYTDRFELPIPIPLFDVVNENIFIGNAKQGYEILVYDLEGNLKSKIKKEFKPVEVSEDYKDKIRKYLEDPIFSFLREKAHFPKYFQPFQFLIADDAGRLFVMTYEKGENPKEYIFDIFNPEGVFIARKSLEVFLSGNFFEPGSPIDSWVVCKQNRLYCLREKESGFKELVVYRTKWE